MELMGYCSMYVPYSYYVQTTINVQLMAAPVQIRCRNQDINQYVMLFCVDVNTTLNIY